MTSDHRPSGPAPARRSETADNDDWGASIWNAPNALCAIRLVGSLVLVGLIFAGGRQAFMWLFACLLATDWLDGRLATLLHQRTTFGARLDSFADAALYTALLLGVCWFQGDVVRQEAVWFSAALASYAMTSLAGYLKFGRLPSYHTAAAKSCWLLVSLAALALFAEWHVWPTRLAAAAVTLTNVEATAITFLLPYWEANVTSIFHVLRDRSKRQAD